MPRTPMHTERLPYRPPYDWHTVLAYFRNHQVPHVETVDFTSYERVVQTSLGVGWFRVHSHSDSNSLQVTLHNGTNTDFENVARQVRRMFDLDANPTMLKSAMGKESGLSSFWKDHPGLRLARAWDIAEALFGTVLGQLVSIAFGRVLLQELMHAAGTTIEHPKTSIPIALFPTITELLNADISTVRTSPTRRRTIHLLAENIHNSTLSLDRNQDLHAVRKILRAIPGVGPWTTEYVALRGFGDNDAFPSTDYVLKREIKNPRIDVHAVRPLRGYAAVALWKRYSERSSSNPDLSSTRAPS